MNTIVNTGLVEKLSGRQHVAVAGEHRRLALVACGLGAVLGLAWGFELESPAFYRWILPLACGGAVIHHWLPRSFQAWFFSALSLAGVLIVFGFGPGAWLIGLGLGLIALCHVPVAFRWRVALVATAGLALMLSRMGRVPAPWPSVIWPVFASMFMFRLGIYLYDLKHHGPSQPGLVVSYFFLLPNVVFLLFPVIDFHTFRRTYYDRRPVEIYEEGVRWILRGMTHLVAYRLLYQVAVISPAEVTSTAGIVRYLVSNYGLYLHISGQFHVIVGILHLFGFRLPETHRFFYLASSFSDFWRRINIYWKDFMQKMVYLPAVMGSKGRGELAATVGATLCVLGASWALRSYQWFWLLGSWLVSLPDILFWLVLGSCLLANTLWQQRRGRARQLTARTATPHPWRQAVQTAGMFGLMCVLWGFWTSPSVQDFWGVLRAATWRPADALAVLGTLAIVAVAAYVTRWWGLGAPAALTKQRSWWQQPLLTAAVPLSLLWAAGSPLAAPYSPSTLQLVAREARDSDLNAYEAERLQRGYYEKLTNVNNVSGQLWELYARGGRQGGGQEADDGDVRLTQWTDFGDDSGNRGYAPMIDKVLKGGRFQTNRWGMRDRDYQETPPPATRRIAIIGPSYVVGIGVNNDETFEAVTEERLNKEWSRKTGLRYELLNFGLAGMSLAEAASILESRRVGQFRPDVVIVVGNLSNPRDVGRYYWLQLRSGSPIPEPVIGWIRDASANNAVASDEFVRRMEPHSQELMNWVVKRSYSAIDRMGAQPVFALIPIPEEKERPKEKRMMLTAAREAGFLTIDMQDVFDGYAHGRMTRDEIDHHPNPEGNRVIAARLFGEVVMHPPIVERQSELVEGERHRRQTEWAARWTGDAPLRLGQRTLSDREIRAKRENLEEMKERSEKRGAKRPTAVPPRLDWHVEAHGGSVATLNSLEDPARLRVDIPKLPQRETWHVKLRRTAQMTAGHRYRLSFRVRADSPRRVGYGVELNQPPWDLLSRYESVEVGAEWKSAEVSFKADEDQKNARIFFNLGTSDAPAEFAQIELRDLVTGALVEPQMDSSERAERARRRAERETRMRETGVMGGKRGNPEGKRQFPDPKTIR